MRKTGPANMSWSFETEVKGRLAKLMFYVGVANLFSLVCEGFVMSLLDQTLGGTVAAKMRRMPLKPHPMNP